MKEIILTPLKGACIKGIGDIYFGYSKELVKEILGLPQNIDNKFYYYNSELRIDFDGNGNVESIECLSNDDSESGYAYL